MSSTVHTLPSLHGALLNSWTHPAFAVQASEVQGFPSSQDTLDAGTQAPAWQWSPVVQASPSSHPALVAA
jgi:hypothetical protein